METVWLNGTYMPLSEGSVSLEDRALQFADGVYEVIAAYDGVPILLREHLERMERSAAGLRMPSPYTFAQRAEVIGELIARLGSGRAMVYGQLSRGAARRAHPFPATPQPNEYWYARALPPINTAMYEKGVGLISVPDERWARCWIKSTCLLANVLAKQDAVDAGAFDVMMVREDGTVTEASAANLYAVKDGVIHTHPADGRILAGCKRSMVLDVARGEGLEVREEKFHETLARSADELFLTSTTINVVPATALDGKPVGTGQVGPIARRLNELVGEQIRRAIADGAAA